MSKERFKKQLGPYLPEASLDLVFEWLKEEPVRLKITKPRSSKLGDFRVNSLKGPAQISVNGNLNPYSFLITLTHEIAHYRDFVERRHLRNAHGEHWQRHYRKLLMELQEAMEFPADLKSALDQHIARPKAASCSDPKLNDALRKYDSNPGIRLKDLHEKARFTLSTGREFVRHELRRTRYKCQEVKTGKWYLIHGEVEVMQVNPDKS